MSVDDDKVSAPLQRERVKRVLARRKAVRTRRISRPWTSIPQLHHSVRAYNLVQARRSIRQSCTCKRIIFHGTPTIHYEALSVPLYFVFNRCCGKIGSILMFNLRTGWLECLTQALISWSCMYGILRWI